MSTPNPQVSVFHFTSRISSAKIRKYKLATERGMSGNAAITNMPSGALGESDLEVGELPVMEPPAKRPKLKLNVRRRSEAAESIAVSRPKRDSALRIRYSENMVIDDKDLDEDDPQRKSKPSPAASSDLSSFTSVFSREKDPVPAKAPIASPAKQRDYSRDFMSYYVTGGDDEEETKEDEVVEVTPREPAKTPAPLKPSPANQPPPARPQEQSTKARTSNKIEPLPQTHPRLQSSHPNVPPPPTVQLIENTSQPGGLREPNTVASMIVKLNRLSTALTNFGGIPAAPGSPQENSKDDSDPQSLGESKAVDNFLAMFDDDDDDDGDEDVDGKPLNETKPSTKIQHLDYQLDDSSEEDSPLTYGIQFIQNALKSWAIQRTLSQYNQQYFQHQQARLDNQSRRGPGRPRKFDGTEEGFRSLAPPTHITIELASTPEGAAISAFQEVLDSGCLRVNATLPTGLTQSLRRLYMQIDHLINQGSRNEPPWQCMSYAAQISAHRIRVDKWKTAQAQAHEEMIRQQQLAQQQMLQQMGIPPHQRNVSAHQVQQQHAIDLERKRNFQHAAQQPHLTQYLTNPLRLDSAHAKGPDKQTAGENISASPADATSTTHVIDTTHVKPIEPESLPTQGSGADGKDVRLDKIKLYMPNYLPRSGQSMKFSFAPNSELALQTFGRDAFPANHSRPNIPNRGPMKAAPRARAEREQHTVANGVNAMPVVSSNTSELLEPNEDVEMTNALTSNGNDVLTRPRSKGSDSASAKPNSPKIGTRQLFVPHDTTSSSKKISNGLDISTQSMPATPEATASNEKTVSSQSLPDMMDMDE